MCATVEAVAGGLTVPSDPFVVSFWVEALSRRAQTSRAKLPKNPRKLHMPRIVCRAGDQQSMPNFVEYFERYGDLELHRTMIGDDRRTSLQKHLGGCKAGDVVLDIGTGTGVLAMLGKRPVPNAAVIKPQWLSLPLIW